MDSVVWILISSLLGARLTYVIFHFDEFHGRILDAFNPFQSDGTIGIAGLVVLGGILAALPTARWYWKKQNQSFWQMSDLFLPSLALGLAIGRLGCFFNGCCYGHPTDMAWGVVFPETCLAGAHFPDTPIHPTQLYETAYGLLIFGVLLWRTEQRKFKGELLGLFFVLYGIFRFTNELFRQYDSTILFALFGLNFTFSMSVSLMLLAAGIGLLKYGYQNGIAPQWIETKIEKTKKRR